MMRRVDEAGLIAGLACETSSLFFDWLERCARLGVIHVVVMSSSELLEQRSRVKRGLALYPRRRTH